MTRVQLLPDEQIWLGLAQAFRQSGYDVVHVNGIHLSGIDDEPLQMLEHVSAEELRNTCRWLTEFQK